jgi:hypothetical protein
MGRLVLEERGSQYGLANALVQVARVDDVHVVSPEQCAQFLTQVHDLPARRVTRFKLDQTSTSLSGRKSSRKTEPKSDRRAMCHRWHSAASLAPSIGIRGCGRSLNITESVRREAARTQPGPCGPGTDQQARPTSNVGHGQRRPRGAGATRGQCSRTRGRCYLPSFTSYSASMTSSSLPPGRPASPAAAPAPGGGPPASGPLPVAL